MLTKRIIPCLDIKEGRTVKGTNFVNLRDAGDPVELAVRYSEEGADELIFLDITASNEKRKTLTKLVCEIARCVNIPFTVGGGINTADDVMQLLDSGADKISLNTSAVNNPALVDKLASNFGSQCVVVAVDAKKIDGRWKVATNGGQIISSLDVLEWSKELSCRGAGEILLTSMENDGTKNGFANNLVAAVSDAVSIPVIASGGAGSEEHFLSVFKEGHADAALAASVFHFREIEIRRLKRWLKSVSIPVRI